MDYQRSERGEDAILLALRLKKELRKRSSVGALEAARQEQILP